MRNDARLLSWLVCLALTAGDTGSSTASVDGAWVHVPAFTPRVNLSTIYDPIGDRLIAYGGFDAVTQRSDVWELSFPLSGSSSWSQLDVPAGPPPRAGHSAIYDPLNQRMLIFGGVQNQGETQVHLNDTWALSLQGTPTWTHLITTGTPAGRYIHAAVYDSRRHRMVVHGGRGGGVTANAVYILDLNSLAWTDGPVINSPAREEHAAVYDSLNDCMLVFGGDNGTTAFDTTHKLTFGGPNPGWSQLSLFPNPSARWGHAGVLDRARREFVIFGGGDATGVSTRNDMWRLPLDPQPTAWQSVPLTSSINRRELAAVYDNRRSRMLLCGGWEGYKALQEPEEPIFRGDAWAIALTPSPTLVPLITQPQPGALLSEESLAYSFWHELILLFGGRAGMAGVPTNDVYALSTVSDVWEKWTPSGSTPGARQEHTAIYDEGGDRMVAFGGTDGVSGYNDVWALDPTTRTWSLLFAPPIEYEGTLEEAAWPGPRWAHTAIYADDPTLPYPRMVVFGGQDGTGLRNDVWTFDLGTLGWQHLSTSGPSPPARRDHTAVFDRAFNRMIVFGGMDGSLPSQPLDDLWILDLNTNAWAQVTLTPRPSKRAHHVAVFNKEDSRMIVFGGVGVINALQLRDVWALGLATPASWTQLSPAGLGAAERMGHGVAYDDRRNRMVFVGGRFEPLRGLENFNDTWAIQWDPPSGGGGGCPFVDVRAADGWREENSILGRSRDGSLSRDVYRLRQRPVVDGGRLQVRIRENEQEETRLDEARLVTVDHRAGIRVFSTSDGFVLGTRRSAFRVTRESGEEITGQVNGSGGPYQGQPGDVLFVDLYAPGEEQLPLGSEIDRGGAVEFEEKQGPALGGGASLRPVGGETPTAIDAFVLDRSGVLVQVPDGRGGWRTIEHCYPRETMDETVLAAAGYSRLRLQFVGRHRLGFVGVAVPVARGIGNEHPLLTACHSRVGDVTTILSRADGQITSLVPSDTVALQFEVPPVPSGMVRDYFLVTNGVYGALGGPAAPAGGTVPVHFALHQNRPNPFSHATSIAFDLPVGSAVRLDVFDLQGRRIRTLVNHSFGPGRHVATWDRQDHRGRDVPVGVYLYRLTAGEYEDQKRMILLP